MSTISSFKSIENKYYAYGGNDCMKKFCKFLRVQAIKIINFKKEKHEVIDKRTTRNI